MIIGKFLYYYRYNRFNKNDTVDDGQLREASSNN